MDTFDFFVLHNRKFLTVRTHLPSCSFFFRMFFRQYSRIISSTTYCSFCRFFSTCPSYSTLSAISASGFSVLTLKKKYNRWHTHTITIQILPTGTFFMQINPIAITTVTVPTILHFVPIVMALFWTKLSRCFLYKFVPMNQSCSFFELLAKQNSVAM